MGTIRREDGQDVWIHLGPYSTFPTVTYTNWYDGEPSDSGGLEDCVELIGTDGTTNFGWTWNDKTCGFQLPFVCELPVYCSFL